MLKGGSLSKNDEITVCLQLAQLQLGSLSQGITAELGTPQSHFYSLCQRRNSVSGIKFSRGHEKSPERNCKSLSRLVVFLAGVSGFERKPNYKFLLIFQGNLCNCEFHGKFYSEKQRLGSDNDEVYADTRGLSPLL